MHLIFCLFILQEFYNNRMTETPLVKKKHRGIPEALFLNDVDAYMVKESSSETALQKLDEQFQKYRFMESNLLNKKIRLSTQIPDIKATLSSINFLKNKKNEKEPLKTQFMLSDQLFVHAKVPTTDKVCLWLGANVMLEYNIDEADELLKKNLSAAESQLLELDNDLDYLRDQITTTEVSMARIYNWDVKRRQKLKISS
nr:prefoldin subunit 3 isoform X2 [Hydra vulgaris]